MTFTYATAVECLTQKYCKYYFPSDRILSPAHFLLFPSAIACIMLFSYSFFGVLFTCHKSNFPCATLMMDNDSVCFLVPFCDVSVRGVQLDNFMTNFDWEVWCEWCKILICDCFYRLIFVIQYWASNIHHRLLRNAFITNPILKSHKNYKFIFDCLFSFSFVCSYDVWEDVTIVVINFDS